MIGLPPLSQERVADPQGDLAFIAEQMKLARESAPENVISKKLSQHIHEVWVQNQRDNRQTRMDMINALRRVRGEYDPAKLSAIRAFQGSETFIRSGENKCKSAYSWITDIYRGDTSLPWELQPTEIPDLPEDTIEQAKIDARFQAKMIEEEIRQSGAAVDTNQVAELVEEYYEEMLQKKREEIKKEAKDKCNKAASLIRDQNQEGGWNNAFKDFLYYFIRLKAGIIKGPVLTKKKKQVWQVNELGEYDIVATDVTVPDVYCVSPFNFYPSKGMKDVNNGDLIEVHELTLQSITNLIGVAGYDESEIRAVIEKYTKGSLKAKWFTIDDETLVKQVTKEKNYTQQTTPSTSNAVITGSSDLILAQEFYGTVKGSLLKEWGVQGNIDPDMQYPANCWKIGDHVIKAVIMPDPLGRKPYFVSSWSKNPEWIWGEGLIEFAAPIEDAINSITRALINNIAIASGPMAEIDKDRVDMRQPISPWRQIESTSMQMKNDGPAVIYYQPNMHANELIQAWQFFSKVLDEMTVPAYAQGASQSGVTAGTATVFTQLLAAASRSIKAVVANIDDDVITPYIQMCYDNNMRDSDDNAIKGDVRAIAKGVSGLQAREQEAQRKVELLQVCAQPVYAQILGAKNIGSILAQIFKANNIELPDMEQLEGGETAEQQLQQLIMQQSGVDPNQENGQMSNGGGQPSKPQGLLADGSKSGVVN